jgi:putative zinc finger/helix-turn-helix YgiT family protein
MDNFCPICEKKGKVERILKTREFNVRGESIKVEYEAYKCDTCGETFLETKTEDDPLVAAYTIYRKKHNMLQPDDIKKIRMKYGISQAELGRLLGWGGATLSRYENGALQDRVHDGQLSLISDPRNMLKLIKENTELFGEQRAKLLIKNLTDLARDEFPLHRCIEEIYGNSEQSAFTGFASFNYDKFLNAILFFCRGGLLKTKIVKYLFYADFKHFREYSTGITGATYYHLPLGPVPDKYDIFLASFLNDKFLEMEEVFYPDYTGEKFLSVSEPYLSIFSDTELKILTAIKDYFKDYTAKAISEYSHQEKGYLETASQEPISYEFAKYLRF